MPNDSLDRPARTEVVPQILSQVEAIIYADQRRAGTVRLFALDLAEAVLKQGVIHGPVVLLNQLREFRKSYGDT